MRRPSRAFALRVLCAVVLLALAACDNSRPDFDAMVSADVAAADAVDTVDAPTDRWTPPDGGNADVAPAPVSRVLPGGEVIAPETSDDAPSLFGRPDSPTDAPRVLYPEDGTILPPNLHGLEILIQRGLGNNVFELTFEGARETVRVYRACRYSGSVCALRFDTVLYPIVLRVARDNGYVRVRVRGTSTDGESPVGGSAPITLGFTQEPLQGAVYYFNTGGGLILRYDFDRPEAPPEVFLGRDGCHGCHSLSRDGRRISTLLGTMAGGRLRAYEVATRTRSTYEFPSSINALSPDGRRLIASSSTGPGLALHDADTGLLLNELQGYASVDAPVWSPDNTSVVFAATGGPSGRPDWEPPLLYRTQMAGDRFAPAVPVAMGEDGVGSRPAFTWDGQWIAFNRLIGEMTVFGATLWMMPASGSAPVHLARADQDSIGDARWPRFAPFAQVFQGEPLVWVSFTSPRLLYPDETGAGGPQLFMSAIRPNRVARGEDPSAPAFWLPFQQRREGNHDAQWAERVPPRIPCNTDADCPSGLRCIQVPSSPRSECLDLL